MDIGRPEDLSGIEHALGALKPAPARLDRDALLFEAGRAAGRAESRQAGLRLVCAALVFVSLGLSGLAWTQHRELRDLVALVPSPEVSPPAEVIVGRPDPSSYLALRHSLDVPAPVVPTSPPTAPGEPGTLTVRDAARVVDF